jgi:predicted ATP-dependent serine protease
LGIGRFAIGSLSKLLTFACPIVSDRYRRHMTMQRIDELAAQNIELWQRQMEHPEDYRPIKTNLADLDRHIGGILDNAYYVIGGPHKSAKTTLALQLAMTLSTHGRTDYFQLEEVRSSMATRALVHGTKLTDRTMIRDLKLESAQFADLHTSQKMLEKADLWIEDTVNTAQQIIDIAIKDNARFCVVDYLQLLNDNNRQVNEATRLESISRQFITARNAAANSGGKRTFIVVYQMNEQGKAHGSRTVYKDCDGALEVCQSKDPLHPKEFIDGSIDIHILPGRVWQGGHTVQMSFNGAHSLIRNAVIFDVTKIGTSQESDTIRNRQESMI